MNSNYYCVIMAGGLGTRFWPLSKTAYPKQFLDILGTGKTLLQQTFDRFKNLCPAENIYIVTNKMYTDIVLTQLPEIKASQILAEPFGRNTAPCIAYANFRIQRRNPNAIIVVAPSDHLILDTADFLETIQQGFNYVEERNALITLGIKPSRPETGYGYIQMNPDLKSTTDNGSQIAKVKSFAEKPPYEMAKIFFESGEFFWNAGIFIWNLKSIQNAFKVYLADVYKLFDKQKDSFGTENESDVIEQIYKECKNISIDYGVMEHAENVYVIPSDFGWSDLGTWQSLYEKSEKDSTNNVINASNVLTYDTNDCIVISKNQKLVVLQGLSDSIVVDTNDVLLICKRENEAQFRTFVNDVKNKVGEQYV